MIKKITYIALLVLLIACHKDDISSKQSESFIKFLGGELINEAADIKVLPDGNYVVLGKTDIVNRGTEMFLAKVDKFGNELWHRTYGYSKDDWGASLQLLPTGEILALGNVTDTVSNKTNLFLVKVALDGNLIWEKSIGSSKNDIGYYLHLATDGSYLLVGSSDSIVGGKSAVVFQTNNEGSVLKVRLTGYTSSDKLLAVTETNSYYYIAGTTKKEGDFDVFILQYRKDLPVNIIPKIISVDGDEELKSIIRLADSSFMIMGKSIKADGLSSNLLLLKTDQKLTRIPMWDSIYGGEINNNASHMLLNPDSTLTIIGTKALSETNTNAWLFKTDLKGNVLSEKLYGATGLQTGAAIAATPDGGYIIAGANKNGNNSMITLIKVKPDGGL